MNATINEMRTQILSEARRLGFGEATIWQHWLPKIDIIAKYYRGKGVCFYDPAVTESFLQTCECRYHAGEVSFNYYNELRKMAKRLNEFYLTNTLHIDPKLHGTRYILNAGNERLVDLFVTNRGYDSNTRDDAIWAVRKYLHHFELIGHKVLGTVTIEDVRQFILKTAAEVKLSTLHNIFLYLRHFHIFLKETGADAPDCVELFSHKVYREMPVQGYVTDDELGRILNVIDLSTESGKRNRAIILLGATTGLRACDIIRLKLTDIDWRKGEVRVEQSKTDHTVCVPLLEETGAAIQDYILNARPKTGCTEVFLRCVPPKIAIQDAVCIGCMFKDYERRAGIERHPFDGKGFHGLRRRLAKKLLVSGSSITTIAQILGHEDVQSALQYLALDTNSLKECALDFTVIPITRRELR